VKASCIRLRSLVVPAMLLLMLWCGTTHAQKLWDGESAANDNWSTGQNWDGDTSPPNPYSSGTINFNNTDLGNQNVVDANWTIATLWYTNSVWGQGHTTDLGGNELVVQSALVCGGNPDVVYNNSVAPKQATANTEATLQNGALQLGTASLAANVIVGYLFQYGSYPGGAFNPTNNTLTIAATVGCTNLSSFYIGFRDYI